MKHFKLAAVIFLFAVLAGSAFAGDKEDVGAVIIKPGMHLTLKIIKLTLLIWQKTSKYSQEYQPHCCT